MNTVFYVTTTMTQIIDIKMQELFERKYRIENTHNWFKKSYWFKQSELKKIDNQLQDFIRYHFTKIILPYKKYKDFTFDDIFETYLEYYIIDDIYIPLGKYIETYKHTEMVGITDPVQTQFINAIFEKDSSGSNIYTSNDTMNDRPIYVKTVHLHAIMI